MLNKISAPTFLAKHLKWIANDMLNASKKQIRREITRAATADARGANENIDDRPAILPIIKKMIHKKASVFSIKNGKDYFFKKYRKGASSIKTKSYKDIINSANNIVLGNKNFSPDIKGKTLIKKVYGK